MPSSASTVSCRSFAQETVVRPTLVVVFIAVFAGMAAAETVESGKRTFERACAACHGTSGRGNGPGAADLNPHPRDLTANAFRFRSTASGGPPLPADLER